MLGGSCGACVEKAAGSLRELEGSASTTSNCSWGYWCCSRNGCLHQTCPGHCCASALPHRQQMALAAVWKCMAELLGRCATWLQKGQPSCSSVKSAGCRSALTQASPTPDNCSALCAAQVAARACSVLTYLVTDSQQCREQLLQGPGSVMQHSAALLVSALKQAGGAAL